MVAEHGETVAPRPFRFGVEILPGRTAQRWLDAVRHAEDLGYDVLHTRYHLGMPALFPALALAAGATDLALCQLIDNVNYYRSAVLLDDIRRTNAEVGGRLEIGISATQQGPVRTGEATARNQARANALASVVELTAAVDTPPLMVAADDEATLRAAARGADIVQLSAQGCPEAISRQAKVVREEAGPRFDSLELGLVIPSTDSAPGVLTGSARAVADTLSAYAELGISYFTVLETHMADFAKVIAALGHR